MLAVSIVFLPFLCQWRRAVSDAGSSLSDRIYADLIMTIQHGSATPYLCFGDGRVGTALQPAGAKLTQLLSADAWSRAGSAER